MYRPKTEFSVYEPALRPRIALQLLVAASCTTSTLVYLDTGVGLGNLGVWQVTPRPVNPVLFPNGQYSLANVGRAATTGCAQTLNDVTCAAGNGVFMGAAGETLQKITLIECGKLCFQVCARWVFLGVWLRYAAELLRSS